MKIVEWLAQRAIFRSALVIGAAIVVLAAATAASPRQSTRVSTPEGPGSVFGAPHLPAGFTKTFTSRYVEAGQVRLHAVIGGDGPPLLLVHGCPMRCAAASSSTARSTSRPRRTRSARPGG